MPKAIERKGSSPRSRVRLRPTGGNSYTVTVDRVAVARAYFARYRTGEGMRAEAWIERPDGGITDMVTAYFADFVRRVKSTFDLPPE